MDKKDMIIMYLCAGIICLYIVYSLQASKILKYQQVEEAFNHVLEKERMKNEIKIELRAADSLNIVNDGVCGDS